MRESLKKARERAARAVELIEREYPAECSLEAADPLQLLIATRLSAQCTDARVNMVRRPSSPGFPTPKALPAPTWPRWRN